jgi:tRNA threonylcarbamoyl adenosine modification protein (Sua5/YciO/YrdC/YwlC family)
MAQFFKIHPDNPQKRLITQSVEILRNQGVIAYPTDSSYALGCLLDNKSALERISRIRGLDKNHLFTIICPDLTGLGLLARLDNSAFRLIKSYIPGPYTFILKASKEVPRRIQNNKRSTIGLRVPDNTICKMLLEAIGEPILSTSLILPGDDLPLFDPDEIDEKIGNQIDLIIDGGMIGVETTTVIDITGNEPIIIRTGKGAV